MAFPPATITPPTLTPAQIWFNGLTMGGISGDGGVSLKEIDGLDIETSRSGDAGRARDHGEFAGLDLLGGRDITVKMDVAADVAQGITFQQAMSNLATATVPQGAIETPFYVATPWGTYGCMARPRNRSWKYDEVFDKGAMAQDVSVLWHGTDPRWYSVPTVQSSCSLQPVTDLGFTFPISFPLSFGGAESPSSVTIVNLGNIDCRPILTITGPVTNPSVSNGSLAGNPTITFDINLRAGNRLIVDTDLQAAQLWVLGATSGTPILSSLAPGSQWWSLQPGTNIIQFGATATSGTPSLSVEWASAYLL